MLHLQLSGFEGPLDLLLALVERGELDVTAIALVQVTEHYLAQLRSGGACDAEDLAAFVVIGSRLVELKSLALLPRPVAPPPEEPDERQTAAELTMLLQEYRRFRAVAEGLRGREQEGLRSFPRLVPSPPQPPGPGLSDVTLDRLVAIVQEALRRRPPEPAGEVPAATVTVQERLAALEAMLARDGRVSFGAFIASSRSRIDVVVGFMAVLELIKSRRVAAVQPEAFGDILIVAQTAVAAGGD